MIKIDTCKFYGNKFKQCLKMSAMHALKWVMRRVVCMASERDVSSSTLALS